ncbi:MAG TPA: FGGY family carbohydrate kinase [Cellulomonas sp.]
MTGDLVVAVDCSTTAAKAVVVDAAGSVVAAASRPLATATPAPGFHEQDATSWYDATAAAVAAAVGALGDPARVGAVCVTHQRESFVLLDEAGVPLRPAILWVDSRAHAEIAELGSARVHAISGKPPDTTPALYKLAWLARHEPEALARAAAVADVQAYLALRLTGRLATSHASADTLGLFSLERLDWSGELVALAGLRTDQLPALVDAGSALGDLTPAAARDLGLPAPVPLVAGIGDGQSAGLALGVEEVGVAYLNLGTSMVCGVTSQEYLTSPAFRTLVGARPGTYVLETVLNAAAYLASWAVRQFGDGDLAATEAAAALLPVGAEGLLTLPYWNAAQTPYWDPSARGAVVGWHGRHTPAHLYRSILEGVALELRLQLTELEQATGTPVSQLRAVGGGARSPLWTQIVADATGREVQVMSDGEVSAAGAAVLAHEFLGHQRTRGWTVGGSRTPDPDAAGRYDVLYEPYRELYPALSGVMATLSRVSGV